MDLLSEEVRVVVKIIIEVFCIVVVFDIVKFRRMARFFFKLKVVDFFQSYLIDGLFL